jgi:hypothetical protein
MKAILSQGDDFNDETGGTIHRTIRPSCQYLITGQPSIFTSPRRGKTGNEPCRQVFLLMEAWRQMDDRDALQTLV